MTKISGLLAIAAVLSQQAPSLDLTVLVDRGPLPVIGGVGSTSSLSVSVALVELQEPAVVGDALTYEVEITNNATTPLTIPWSGDPLWESDVDTAEQLFRATLGLSVSVGTGPEQRLDGTIRLIYGNVAAPASVLVLPPGGSARIKAAGSWSVYGINLRQQALASAGQAQVRATLRLQRGMDLANAPPSPARPVILTVP